MQQCPRCQHKVAAGALVCEQCRTLLYASQLEILSANAKSFEQDHRYTEAKEDWEQALKLLPAESKQAAWIRDHVRELENTASAMKEFGFASQAQAERARAKVSAFIVSLAAFLGFEYFYGGLGFGVGLTALILIHEFGHYIDLRRRGMHADLPVFLPGLGAFVRFRSRNVSREVRAGVSLAGPLAGFVSAAVCAVVWKFTGDLYWASLAQSGAMLNMLNLAPVWMLDGGQAASALGKAHRVMLLVIALVLWKFTGESLMVLVCGGAAFRVFAKDAPEESSSEMAYYFVAVLILLAAVMYVVPGKGFGIR